MIVRRGNRENKRKRQIVYRRRKSGIKGREGEKREGV